MYSSLLIKKKYFFQGDKTIDISKTYLGFPYIINFCNLTQVRCCTGYVRPIRRIQQAPYPLVKVALEELQVTSGRKSASVTVKSSTVKVTHKKSSNGSTKKNNKKVSFFFNVMFLYWRYSLVNCLFQSKSGETNGPTNIARVILSNFNIFGSKHGIENTPAATNVESAQKRKTWDVLDVDSSSTKSGRRPSVDTVSTYLSHENPIDLLDSSMGSDDAFKDSILGVFLYKNTFTCFNYSIIYKFTSLILI